MIGFDCGTYNLVCCQRDAENRIIYKREINAFLEIPLENRFLFNMMRDAKDEHGQGVPLIERDNVAYMLGQRAVDMAYAMNSSLLKRPMKDGCVNPKEINAYQIMSIMIHSLLDEVKQDKETLYYSVPANAVNEETDADYHNKILEAIFNAFEDDQGRKVVARPINEALALVYAELAPKAYTGFGISFGAGMVNVCYAMYGAPLFSFAIVNSGDWIDKMAAKAIGEDPVYINKEKEKIDLSQDPKDLKERAIQTQYRLMVEKTIAGIQRGLSQADKKARSDTPVDIVISGGSASPPGFDKLFKDVLAQAKLPLKIGEIVRPADTLYSVSRGCLLAAENAT